MCSYWFHTWNHGSFWSSSHSSASTHLLSITAEGPSTTDTEPASVVFRRSSEWTDSSSGHAANTADCFCTPQPPPTHTHTRHPSLPSKTRLNSTFHIACQILSKLHVMMLLVFEYKRKKRHEKKNEQFVKHEMFYLLHVFCSSIK